MKRPAHRGRAWIASSLAAVTITTVFSSPAHATTYSYAKIGDNSAQSPLLYTDTIAEDDYLLGLTQLNSGINSSLEVIVGTNPEFSDPIDLFLNAKSFASADIDGDGVPDYAVVTTNNPTTNLTIYYSDRADVTVQLTPPPGNTCGSNPGGDSFNWEADRMDQPVIGDINHDGMVDITVVNNCAVFSFDEDGWSNPGWPLTNNSYHKVTLADLDGDGKTDVLVASNPLLQAIRGNGTEIWHRDYSGLHIPVIGNVDGGTDQEIVASADKFDVLKLDGTVKQTEPWVLLSPTPFTTVRLCDVDGDGNLDLVTQSGQSKVYAYTLTGSRTLMSGFPATVPGPGGIQGEFLCANLTKTSPGNDLLVPTGSGLLGISRAGSILYNIGSGSVTDLVLGSTDGTNFVAMANFGNTQEVYKFTTDGTAATLADQPATAVYQQNLDNRRTANPAGVPLRQGSPQHHGDLNHDGRINITDVSLILANWHQSGTGDIDGSGVADIYDLSRLFRNWTG